MKILKSKVTKCLAAFIVMCMMLGTMIVPAYAASISIQEWHLVDSGKHLDWDGSTIYQTQFNSAVKVWNDYKSGVIRKDSLTVIEDVTIRDYEKKSGVVGETFQSGKGGIIQFNKYTMNGLETDGRKHACIHELGHALGLDHNKKGDVMYETLSTIRTTLSENDKASYDKSYERY